MRNLILVLAFLSVGMGGYAQSNEILYNQLKARSLSKWDVPAGNYSAIVPLYDNCYAVVCDKSDEGFYIMQIEQDNETGQVENVEVKGFFSPDDKNKSRDAEGIAFRTSDSTLWISYEADQKVVAYKLDGERCDKTLEIPSCFRKDSIWPNYGFEALTYDEVRNCFWTVTENQIKRDGKPVSPENNMEGVLRIQSYADSGAPMQSYMYRLEKPKTEEKGKSYAYGVSAVWASKDGSLMIIEREFDVAHRPLKSKVYASVYMVTPGVYDESDGDNDRVLKKEYCFSVNTSMRLINPKIANYEGLCSGITLPDGRKTLLMISDSQGGYGNIICHLKDWIKVIVLP